MRVKSVRLKHHRHIAIFRVQIIDAVAIDQDLAFGDILKASNHPHRGGLAASGRAKQHKKLLIRNGQIEIVDADKTAPSLGQIAQLNLSHASPSMIFGQIAAQKFAEAAPSDKRLIAKH